MMLQLSNVKNLDLNDNDLVVCRAVASGLASPVLAGPDFAQETDFLKFKAGHFAHFFRLGGGGWGRV